MPAATYTPERRKHPRVTLDTEVWIGQDGVFTHTPQRLSNLGLGGAFLEVDAGFAMGSILNLRFPIESAFVTATVIVRSVRLGQGIGVEFLDLSPESRDVLEAFMAGSI